MKCNNYRKAFVILKQIKIEYYHCYFESNWNNIKNKQKGLKPILTIKNISADIPKCLTVDGNTVSNSLVNSNIFLQVLKKPSKIADFHIDTFGFPRNII